MEIKPRNIQRTLSAYQYPLLIKHLLHTPARFAPDQEIVYRDKKRITYSELFYRINKLAAGLSSLGVGPDDTVAVLDWDSHRYLECFFAVPMMGAVLHTVNIRLSPEQILFTMKHAEDTVVLVHEDFLNVVESFSDKLQGIKAFILLKDSEEEPTSRLPISAEYEDMVERAESSYDFPDFDEDRHATIFYTTGTTGDPKGVCFSHRHLMIHSMGIGMATGSYSPGKFQSGDVYMPLTPMFHVHAWGFPYLATLLGAKQVYPGKFDPETVLQLRQQEGVTFSHCVATILHMLLTHPKAQEIDFHGWKINTGGMATPSGLARMAIEKGIDLFQGYGMSETCPVLTVANLKPYMLDWSLEQRLPFLIKTGFPIPLVDLKILDDQGKPVPTDDRSPGEIVIRAPWLTQGYFKEPAKSEELWRGGHLHTGDVATMDSEGYVQITDRLKDAIKTGGEWISSLDLESLISRHPAVSEVAVVGIPHEKWGERPIALIVPADGLDITGLGEELKNFLEDFVQKGVTSKWAIPDEFRMVDSIPKTSVGKIDKKVIRSQL